MDYAIFETSGTLSVMKKEHKQAVTKGDLNIPEKVRLYPTPTDYLGRNH
ncbi:DUF421 domain-containing protein [Ammoniphilus sp. YIM 78166]|nr:DUF421 domain-containing protein [Ammoniphilus sp. YIM 78166]